VRRRWLVFGLAALLLVAVGMTVGRRTAGSDRATAPPTATVTVIAPAETHRQANRGKLPRLRAEPYARTSEGAAAAATAYLSALSGPVLLDPDAVGRTLTRIVSAASRDGLVSAYRAAAVRARGQLGVASASDPSLVLRAAAVGYRVDGFQRSAATVSLWRVGIVGGPATVEPHQSWRTETVSLIWEDGTWKIDAVRSSPGPTPPLAGVPTGYAELTAAIPTFAEFTRDLP
jgi:hypothetical protein